ncbi:unnamed protein product [Blepharisma stoltei]|uniref:Phosphatidylinositol-4-phosphate 5-kinase n=1 Tax=Blepharisma stoltei TaxID=1481888 RepID=A0AAU9JD00_9CILI|nr:unnamed protein product [Blepharisma stoltei]
MLCCTKKKKLPMFKKADIYLLSQKYRLSNQELQLNEQRFNRMAQGDSFTIQAFRENMGLLGLQSTRMIADRIFKVMDKKNTGRVTFEEFLDYMDVLMHGTPDEKAYQSFKLVKKRDRDEITYDDFASWLISVWKMYNALTGSEVNASEDGIRKYFDLLDFKKDGVIDFEEYKLSMKNNKELFEWFDFVNRGVAEKFNEEVVPEIQEKNPFVQRLETVEKQLASCIELLLGNKVEQEPAAQVKPPPFPQISPLSLPSLGGQSFKASEPPLPIEREEEEPSYIRTSEIPIDIDEVDLESMLSLADETMDDAHFISDCQLLGDKENFKVGMRKLSEEEKVKKEEEEEKEAEEDIEPEYSGKNAVLSMLRDLSEKMKSLRVDVEENAQDKSPWIRKKSSARTNVPKPILERKNTFVQWGDEDWNLILNMMLGIQKTVKAAATIPTAEGPPTNDDFKEVRKHSLLPGQLNAQRSICRFRDYAPLIFDRIRKFYGLEAHAYIKSLGVEKIMSSLLKSEFSSLIGLMSTGKSGSFFYFSDDGKYVLKTMTREEYVFLKKILPDYYRHLIDNPNTLIPRFFGFHKIMYKNRKQFVKRYFIVMANVFYSGYEVHMRYDLKGSTYGRETNPEEDYTVARKDLDFTRSQMKIKLGSMMREEFLRQVTLDCEFFEHMEIIDYSLLVGIHHLRDETIPRTENAPLVEKDNGGTVSFDRQELYFLGIIDILTFYSARKKLEHMIKGGLYGADQISCVPPSAYASRFINFITSIVE